MFTDQPNMPLVRRLATVVSGAETGRSSLQTLQAVGSAIVGAAYFVYLIAATSSFARFGGLAASWWLPLSMVVVVASGLGLFWVGVSGRLDRLLPVAAAAAIAYLVLMTLWFVAWNGTSTRSGDADPTIIVWFTIIPALACLALVLAERPFLAVANLIVAGALSEAVASAGDYGLDTVLRSVWSIAWCAVYLAMGATSVAFARRLDQTRSATVAAARDLAREDIRDIESRRADALVHDRIIAFLLALPPGHPTSATRSAAAAVLHELDHWWDEPIEADAPVDAREFVQRLRTTVARLGADVAVRADVDASVTARYHDDTTPALLDSAAEAVRNFHRHAGSEASCVVLAVVHDDEITVTVADDGIGYDPDETPPGRLGVSFGITGRMAAVPGGSSSVLSAPGHGTRVRLRWERP
ncbi:sensor histidine kinase [Gordonia liuliyuniae]|uniref:ATP-binding protein n=1 Tax=Gordonia liuliyuniae TaxID=2911517 RepID=A0ABS9IN72_9ACTN|nr:ATP-binding protein [Gordonia liuliyuniae]MCF8586975.1 ATP-binding protein [Gordonia liuliyuniae]